MLFLNRTRRTDYTRLGLLAGAADRTGDPLAVLKLAEKTGRLVGVQSKRDYWGEVTVLLEATGTPSAFRERLLPPRRYSSEFARIDF